MELVITKSMEKLFQDNDEKGKVLVKGTTITVTKELGEKYLKSKCAKIYAPVVVKFKTIRDQIELEKHLQEQDENK
jgi:hypothetical protein